MRLMRASEIIKRPVVTMRGEDIAQVKDIVYSARGGAIGGFTLAGRGMFAGPMKLGLTWQAVVALGADAVMISDESALEATSVIFDAAASGRAGGDVLGSQVLTDSGVSLGVVVDVIVAVGETVGGQCDVVGYEIEASEALGTKGTKLLIPLPDTIAASPEHLMVPASAKDFASHDLAGFGAAVLAFRAQLKGAI